MHLHDPDGFSIRDPASKKMKHTPLVALSPHHKWSSDGHDKLAEIGFPIWGMRDKWSQKWLGLWVVPNNRLNLAIAHLYLQLVKINGGLSFPHSIGVALINSKTGMPLQSTTDCGSEMTVVFGLANVLR